VAFRFRKAEEKYGAFSRLGLRPYRAAVPLDDLAHRRQAVLACFERSEIVEVNIFRQPYLEQRVLKTTQQFARRSVPAPDLPVQCATRSLQPVTGQRCRAQAMHFCATGPRHAPGA